MSLAEEWFNNFKNEFKKFDKDEEIYDEAPEEFNIPDELKDYLRNTERTALIHYFLRKLARRQSYYQIPEYPISPLADFNKEYLADILSGVSHNKINKEDALKLINSKGRIDFAWFELKQIQSQPSILIEHENNLKTIKKEINNLSMKAAKLKILITYSLEKNQISSKLIEAIKLAIKNNEEFLLIVGNQKTDGIMEWDGYILLGGELKEIK